MSIIGSLILLFFFYALQFKFYFLYPPQLSLLPKRLLRNVLPTLIWLASVKFLLSEIYVYSTTHFPTIYNYFNKTSLIELLITQFSLKYFFELLFIVLFFDYATYWWHRFMHHFKWTRKLHRQHHSDLFIDTTTSYRFHILELTLQFLFKFTLSFILGIGFTQLIFLEYLLFFCGLFHHSRLKVPNLTIFVTPQFHFNHHLVDLKYANSNFGSIFTFWDYLHRTNTEPHKNIEFEKFGSL